MRVCLAAYDTDPNTGGVHSWNVRFLAELQRQGWTPSCTIYSSCPVGHAGTLERELMKLGIEFRRVRYEQFTEENVDWTVDAVQDLKADAFITNCILPAWYASPKLEAKGVPCIGVNHSDDPFYAALMQQCVSKEGWYQLAGLVAVSSYLEEFANRISNGSTSISRIPCGIERISETAEFSRNKDSAEPVQNQEFKLAYAGRFVEEQKQVSRVAECMCAAANKYPNFRGYFIGNGPAEESIKRIIRDTGCESQVEIIGWLPVEQMIPTLAKMDAIALLSDYEGLPVVLLEAMSVGVIPICTRMKSGVQELIQDGKNGIFAQPQPEAFTLEVGKLIDNLEFRHRLSKQARATIEDEYLISVCTERWMQFIQTVVRDFSPETIGRPRTNLPPLHRDLEWCDNRQPSPALLLRDKLQKRAAKLKRSVLKRAHKILGRS
ncbi:MAG TPA: hypothetical protein DDW52_22690 [Planctomycetaceae bacterium]|nr:hypothetical protein [Planctomycetaceae bacterium]